MNTLALAILSLTLAADPVPDAVQRAVEARLARLAVEMAPGSLERAEGPACPPYRFFLFVNTRANQVRGVAVSDDGEVAVGSDAASLGRFFDRARFFERHGPADALGVWRLLEQAGPVLDLAALEKLPADERAATFLPRQEPIPGGTRVVGFLRQGEEVFKAQLDVAAGRAEMTLASLAEAMGKDEVDQAVRALRSLAPIIRAAAVFELSTKPDARALQALVSALEDRSAEVRGTTAQALDSRAVLDAAQRSQVIAALKKALAREQDAGAKAALAASLQRLEPKRK
jgi:hypothetical protein